jgi:murein L,D-transpeptidase YcbB/YkuD
MHTHVLRAGIPLLITGLLLAPSALPAQQAVSEALQQRMEELLFAGDLDIAGVPVAAGGLLPDLYASRDFQPLWQRNERIDELLGLLDRAAEDGLDRDDYAPGTLRQLREEHAATGSNRVLADLDILATESLVRYGYHQRFGKVNAQTLDANINFRREFLQGREPLEAIPAVINDPRPLAEVFAVAFPRGPIYRDLRGALASYRDLQRRGGWPSVMAGPTLRLGDQDSRVAEIRRRLAVTGELPAAAGAGDPTFDTQLEAGVRAFQARHGLDADGLAGAQTIAAMNVPVEVRIDQLRLSLERLRWVQEEVGDDFLAVNIAGFRVALFRDREIVWSARAIVGKPYRQTPVFRGDIRYLEFNPTWTVPPGILAKDILPAVKRDPDYLRNRNISVLDRNGRQVDPDTVDWQAYSRGIPYTLRQEPGPDNALGRVKFIFPNEHFVFLHDTPSRALFDRAERTFSSGCIRVDKPFELAELLLDDAQAWDPAAIRGVVDSGRTRRVNLRKPEPVLILYLTASVLDDGSVSFPADIYDRDARVLAVLNGPVTLDLPREPAAK